MSEHKMHKETTRIVGAIRRGGMPTFASKVEVGSWKNFLLVAGEIAAECPTTLVTLGAVIDKPKSLYVAVIAPKCDGAAWLAASLDCGALTDVAQRNEDTAKDTICAVSLEYIDESEQSPFKLVDQVFGSSTSYLKKLGLYQEEEEEHEYGFDDI